MVCTYAVAMDREPICEDAVLSAGLLNHFRRLARWEAHAESERTIGAEMHKAWLIETDVPHIIEDHEDAA